MLCLLFVGVEQPFPDEVMLTLRVNILYLYYHWVSLCYVCNLAVLLSVAALPNLIYIGEACGIVLCLSACESNLRCTLPRLFG